MTFDANMAGQLPPDSPRSVTLPQANGMAVAALVLGSVGIILSVIPCVGVVGFILGVLAVIFGNIGRRRAALTLSFYPAHKRMAIVGLALGCGAIALALISTAFTVSSINSILNFCQAAPGNCG